MMAWSSSLRWTRRGALALALVALPVAAQDDNEDGGGFLENLIEDRLSGPGFEVDVRGFEGALSSRATLASLVISDDDGPWLTVNDVVLDWNRRALLRGRLDVEEFTAAEILLPRLPQGDDSVDVPNPEATPFSLPNLPVSIRIGRIAAERVELGEPVIGEAAALRVEGSATLADGDGEVSIDATRLDEEGGDYAISGSFENETRELTLALGVTEGEDGLIGSIIDLPGRPSLALDVEGSGPLSEFDATIELATAGEPRLAGSVSLRETETGSGFAVDLGGDIAPVFTPQYRPFFGPDIQLTAQGARGEDGTIRLDSFDLSAQSLDLQGQVTIGADGVPDLIDVTGQIAAAEGDAPVLLPVGTDLRVGRVGLDVQFDASRGDEWTGLLEVEGLDQPGVEIARVALDGSGTIAGAGDTLAIRTGFDFDATDIAFDDGGVASALGDSIDGRLEIAYDAGQDVVMDVLRLAGAGFSLDGSGSLDPDGENVPVSLAARLDADDLAVFSALAGRPLSGGISADLDLDATLQDQGFDVTLDGTATDLTVAQPQLDPLLEGETTLALAAARDADGLRVRTLTLDNAAIDLDGSADISSDAGQVALDARIDDLNRIDGQLSGPATLALDAENADGTAWDVDLTAAGAEADIDAQVTISDLGAEDDTSPLASGTASVAAGDLSLFSVFVGRPLGGSLDISLDGEGRFDLSTASAEIAGQTTDIAIGQPELDRLLRGATDIAITAGKDGDRIEAPELRIANPQITVTGSADIAPQDSTADLAIALPELAEIVPSMTGPADIAIDAVEDATGWTVDLDATGAGAEIAADGQITDLRNALSPRAAGTVSVTANDLSVFSELARRDLAGSVDLDAEGQARFDLSTASADVEGQVADIAIGQAELDRLLRGVTDIAITASKDGDRINAPQLSVENPQITVAGSASMAPENGNVDLSVRLPDLSEVVPSMNGPAELLLDAVEDTTGWTVDLDATGAGAEIAADGRITDLNTDASPLGEGTVTITAADLSVFSELARRELGGAVDLDAQGRARFDLSTASGTVAGTLDDIVVGQAELDRLLAGTTRIDADAQKDGDAITLRRFEIANPQVSATADGQYGPGQNAVQAEIAFPDLGRIVTEMSGPGTVTLFAEETGDVWQVTLDGDGAGVTLAAMAEVSDLDATALIDGNVELRAADLSRFRSLANRPLSGSVALDAQGSARIDASRFDVTADARAESLATGIAQVDQLLSGTTALDIAASRDSADAPIRVETFRLDAAGLDANAQGSLLGGGSDLTFNARLANLGTFVDGINGPVTAQGRAGQAGQSFTLDIGLTGPQGIQADVAGQIAESFETANLTVNGNAPLRVANPFLEPRSVDGQANFDLALNGPLALSSVTGQVTVAGGRFVEPSLPLVLDDISATARLNGQSVQLNLTARNQEGGQIRVAGPVGLSGGYDANLTIDLNNVVIEDPRLYRTDVDGQVTVNGALTGGARIGGLLTLDETELRVPSTGLGATGPIPDGLVHVNEPAAVRATRARAGLIDDGSDGSGAGGGVAYPLDLTIQAPNRIFIRGRGLDAELGGALNLGGTTANIIPSGQFELIRGRLDLLGQRLVLTEGIVTLQGDFTPFIRLVAETDAGEVTVRIVIQGPALEPEINFLSDPELPEDEVLSRLLFGRSIDNISPVQAAQLASAVATLAGRGGDGIIANLRAQTGLDDLDVTTDEEGNVGLRAGKYLSENLYTDVTVDAEGEAEINLNLDLSRSVTVRGGASNSGETSLGVFYERDY